LLAVQADVVRVGERLLEDGGGLVEAAAAEREILDRPERADAESALAFGERALVALEERAAETKLSPDAVERRGHSWRARLRISLPLAALFPDAVVGLAVRFAHRAAKTDEHPPRRAVELAAVLDEVTDRAHHLAVEVELDLGSGRVPHPDRSRAEVTAQMRKI